MEKRKMLKREDFEHKALIVVVTENWNGKTGADSNLYEAARYSWPVKTEKVRRKVEVVLACCRSKIVGAFIPKTWYTASDGDSYFDGEEAEQEIQNLYVGRYLDDDLRFYGGSAKYVP